MASPVREKKVVVEKRGVNRDRRMMRKDVKCSTKVRSETHAHEQMRVCACEETAGEQGGNDPWSGVAFLGGCRGGCRGSGSDRRVGMTNNKTMKNATDKTRSGRAVGVICWGT